MRNAGKNVIGVAAALALAACSNSQEPSSVPPGDGPAYPAPNPAGASSAAQSPAQQQRECTADDVKVAGSFGSKPTITIPDDIPPAFTPGRAGLGHACRAGTGLRH